MVRAYNNLFLLLIILLIAWPKYWLFPLGGIAVSPFTLATIAALALFVVLISLSNQLAGRVAVQIARHAPIFVIWVVWIAWRIVADLVGQTPMVSFGITVRTVVYSEAILVLGLLAFSTARVRESLPAILCGIAVGSTLFGVYEYQVQRTLANIFGLSFAGLAEDAAFNATRMAIEFFRDGAYRSASVFSHSIIFAQYVGAMAPIALHLVRFGNGYRRLLGLAALACLPVTLVISGARSGFVVAAAAISLYFMVGFLGKRISAGRLLAIAGAAVVAGILFTSPIQETIESITRGNTSAEQSSSASRDEMIIRGIYALQDRPFTGYGQGLAAEVAGLTGRNNIKTIDNYYLSTAVDFGYIGVSIFIFVVGMFLHKIVHLINRSKSTSETDLARAYFGTAVSIVVGQYIVTIPDNFAIIFLLVALTVAISSKRTSPGSET